MFLANGQICHLAGAMPTSFETRQQTQHQMHASFCKGAMLAKKMMRSICVAALHLLKWSIKAKCHAPEDLPLVCLTASGVKVIYDHAVCILPSQFELWLLLFWGCDKAAQRSSVIQISPTRLGEFHLCFAACVTRNIPHELEQSGVERELDRS